MSHPNVCGSCGRRYPALEQARECLLAHRVWVYWFSRHDPLPRQREALDALYGERVALRRDDRVVGDGAELVRRYRASGCVDLVVVAPLSVIDHICRAGVRPLWCEMEQMRADDPRAEVTAAGRGYRFTCLRRVERLALEFSDATPNPETPSPEGDPR